MTTQTRTRSFIAPRDVRLAAVERTRARLAEVVYRTMRLEGENVTHAEAEAAVEQALGN